MANPQTQVSSKNGPPHCNNLKKKKDFPILFIYFFFIFEKSIESDPQLESANISSELESQKTNPQSMAKIKVTSKKRKKKGRRCAFGKNFLLV